MEREDALKLYEENEKLVGFTLYKYYPELLPDDDARQEACLGLWKACLTFDSTRGTFATYAVRIMRNDIIIYLKGQQKAGRLKSVSLSTPIEVDDETRTIADMVPAPPDDPLEIDLSAVYKVMTDKQKDILRCLLDGKNLRETAQELGVTTQAVSYARKFIAAKLIRKGLIE